MKVKEVGVVLAQEQLATDVYSMWIKCQAAVTAQPGQFVSLYPKDSGKLLPRPISICEIDQAKGALRIVYRVTGADTGTALFSQLSEGQEIDLMGPLGNGFPLNGKKKAFLIGGGIGIPPMLALAQQWSGEKDIILGYRDERFLDQELSEYGNVYIATEDGSCGTKGNVLDAIAAQGLEAEVIFACGPTPMLRAIKEYAAVRQIECYLSLEERMACGIGACLACVCQTTKQDEHSNVNNKRVCKDGPVFLAEEVEL